MTDVTVAPVSAPNPSPQPSQSSPNPSEVVVNQNPINTSNPVGSQAPPAPVGDHKGSEHRTPSRREALQAAFDRANNPPPKGERPAQKPAPRAAEAKPGHNQPPEPTEKLDLKKRPDDQPRGDRGQFAPRQTATNDRGNVATNDRENVAQPRAAVQQLPAHAPYAQPPVRVSERAKKDWAATPESVRGDVHRMHQEFAKAYTFYKNDYEAFKPVKRFHQMAQQHGTTLEKALTDYIGMEHKLRANPIAGIDQILYNLGLTDPATGQRLGSRDWAYTVLSQTPEQLEQTQLGNQQQASSHQIGALSQKVERLEKQNQEMQYRQQFTYTRSAIDQFAESHPRFDELGTIIEGELKFGFDLETAYRRAELLRPATHAAQTRTTPAQTRTPDRSIHGNPDVAGSNPASRRPREASASPRDAVRNALTRMNGHA